ncbi:MAG: indolepyruvate oxidoreductase subunit beta family protein [Alphaproteobacteria bacterium]|nr:indolepyruvate oxidoreductase subunit beta family protein [Alphaproteobacteria bacterium]
MNHQIKRPITIVISALGGQGGGVLTNWLINLAEQCDYFAQSTSIPGVAQRTGATIYYLEMFPKAQAENPDKPPVMALMPLPGDVDLVVAAELMEAGRAVQRQYVTPDKTTLVASTHRVFAVSEKMALGNGTSDGAAVLAMARAAAKEFIAFDMESLAADLGCVISSILFGAIAGAGVLPFSREDFRAAIRAEGKMVEANIRGFDEGCHAAEKSRSDKEQKTSDDRPVGEIQGKANTPEGEALIRRIKALPEPAQEFARAGARKLLDYQDMAYAADYVTVLEGFAASDDDKASCDLSRELARYLALWMAFDDTIRVADIKTRSDRTRKYRAEVGAKDGQIVHMVEFMHPRLQEILSTMPVGMAKRVARSRLLTWVFNKFTGPRLSDTTKIIPFLMLYFVASLKTMRRRTLRYAQEHEEITRWLDRIRAVGTQNYDLAVEIVRCQRLIKGYGDTHARGLGNFHAIMAFVETGGDRVTADKIRRLRLAALVDEDGDALKSEMAA